jgi:hypothetical protein
MSDMKRREFITLLGAVAVAWPLTAHAQQAVPVIGFLRNTTRDDSADLLAAMHQGLRQTGHVEGRNVANIASRIISSIGCRRWQPIWSAVRSS